MKFYTCPTCNQISYVINDQEKPISCCGHDMIELIANIEDENDEHQINLRKVGNFLTVSIDHKMLDVHKISFIFLETNQGFSYKDLRDSQQAKADFILSNHEEVVNCYALCNIHELYSLK